MDKLVGGTPVLEVDGTGATTASSSLSAVTAPKTATAAAAAAAAGHQLHDGNNTCNRSISANPCSAVAAAVGASSGHLSDSAAAAVTGRAVTPVGFQLQGPQSCHGASTSASSNYLPDLLPVEAHHSVRKSV